VTLPAQLHPADGGTLPPVAAAALPGPAGPVTADDYAVFVEALSRVGCHLYSGEVRPDGSYLEIYSGPGVELFLGGTPPPGVDLTTAWNSAVHPEDLGVYRSAATVDSYDVISIEYRMRGYDGVTRWVLDQMWLRQEMPGGRRIVDGVVVDITKRKQAELALLRLAHSDSLTGLANRLRLGERIDAAVNRLHDPVRVSTTPSAEETGLALLLLDLDGFKGVNDSFGHVTGDELLLAVARRLRACIRPVDVASRLGGDEFAVLLEDVTVAEAMVIAERVLTATSSPFALQRSTVSISASIGLVLVHDAGSSEDLVRDADVAMYRAKAEGKNRIVRFEPEMQERVLRQMQLENELRQSIDDQDFVLHYQPLIDLVTGAVVGVEALVRWQHPARGLLPPAQFVGLAEDTGLIVGLGRWVLERACLDAAGWQQVEGRSIGVSVNLSPRQLHDPSLVADIAAALETAGLSPQTLTVEITENLLLVDAELAASRLAELRSLGVRVAIDDFGTGYSSLAYLDRYPIDTLKIDRRFVAPLIERPRSAALVRTIVDLALALGVDAVAEGVETAEQATVLRSLGCHLAQGFHFGRPVPADEMSRLLHTGSPTG
jgi:diguanylate cyclase (GGDEF)-like protein